jgi:hypothetical protein
MDFANAKQDVRLRSDFGDLPPGFNRSYWRKTKGGTYKERRMTQRVEEENCEREKERTIEKRKKLVHGILPIFRSVLDACLLFARRYWILVQQGRFHSYCTLLNQ